jgi:hypothetical protein
MGHSAGDEPSGCAAGEAHTLQLVIFEVDCKLVDDVVDVVGTNASAKASVSYADR